MRKTFSIILAFILIALSTIPAFAAKDITFSVSNAEEVFAGDEFSVDIFVSDYSCLTAASILVQYDDKMFGFLDLNVGNIVEAGEKAVSYKKIDSSAGKSAIQIDYLDKSGTLTSAGKFVTLTFVAKDDAVGNADIKLVAGNTAFTSLSGSVTPVFKNSKINITNNVTVPHTTYTTIFTEASSETDTESVANNSTTKINENSSVSEKVNDSEEKQLNRKTSSDVIIIVVVFLVVIAGALVYTSSAKTKGKKRKKKRKTTSKRR